LVWRAEPEARHLLLKPVLLPLIPQKVLYYLPALTDYLADRRPDLLISADTYCNLVAVWARRLAGTATKVTVSEHNTFSAQLRRPERRRTWRWRHAPALIGHVYPQADAIVTVSHGVGDDLARSCDVPRSRISTIYNAVHFGTDLDRQAQAPVDQSLLQSNDVPIVLGVGRLVGPKDFATLIRAFALVRARRPVRLIILGEEQKRGERARLLGLARSLDIEDHVHLLGHVANPYRFFSRASVFVLSSYREGLGNVLIEALACGCPVVSTDCPHGPAEILDGGTYGRLVPIGDHESMAAAIVATLDAPPRAEFLRARGAAFSAERAATSYLSLAGVGPATPTQPRSQARAAPAAQGRTG
jgi:glycosyltransferase involved in cell wall biosynthesis